MPDSRATRLNSEPSSSLILGWRAELELLGKLAGVAEARMTSYIIPGPIRPPDSKAQEAFFPNRSLTRIFGFP
jgi:hypothetical protein